MIHKIIFEILLIVNLATSLEVRSQTLEATYNWSTWLYKKNSIEARNFNLRHLKGIESLISLIYFDVRKNLIQNLNPLRNLSNLQQLDLAYNKIESIEALENLVKLEYLDISSNQIKSVDSLANLKMLRVLYIQISKKSC